MKEIDAATAQGTLKQQERFQSKPNSSAQPSGGAVEPHASKYTHRAVCLCKAALRMRGRWSEERVRGEHLLVYVYVFLPKLTWQMDHELCLPII